MGSDPIRGFTIPCSIAAAITSDILDFPALAYHMAKDLIVDMHLGSEFETHLGVKFVSEPIPYHSDTKQGRYVKLELSDSSDTVSAIYFGVDADCKDVNDFCGAVRQNQIYNFKGTVDRYQGKKHLKLSTAYLPQVPQEIDPSDFLPSAGLDTAQLHSRLLGLARDIKDGHLQRLLVMILEDKEIKPKLLVAPAATRRHHAYVGGLMEHILEMVSIAETMCKLYPNLDRDMMVSGCILHDIGKIREIDATFAFTYSDEGRLLGHIEIGGQLVRRAMEDIDGFPEGTKGQLLHLIASHHGEHGDIRPQTLEAVALHHIDNLDAQVKYVDSHLVKNLDSAWVELFKSERYLNTLFERPDGA